MDLIDLTDLIDDPAIKKAAIIQMKKSGDRFVKKTGKKAKRYAPEPFKPRGLYTGKIDKLPQIMIYDKYTCVCSNTWVAPRYCGSTFNQIVDSTHKCHFESAAHTLRNYTKMEYHDHSVTVCPSCINSDRTTTDPVLARMFSISIEDNQNALNFDEWLYPVDTFPVVVVSPPTIISKGINYAKEAYQSKIAALASYCPPRYDQVDRDFASHDCTPRPSSRLEDSGLHLGRNRDADALLPIPSI
jgi:hypothetical protein